MPVLDYLKFKRGKSPAPDQNPVLKEEDENFLNKLASEELPPLPARPTIILDNGKEMRPTDAQIALMDGADKIALPMSPPEEKDEAEATPSSATAAEKTNKTEEKKAEKGGDEAKEKKNYWSYIPAIPKYHSKSKDKDKAQAADSLSSAASAIKAGEEPAAEDIVPPAPEITEQEKKDLTSVLDSLNLSAVNNRVFSFSDETQKLMDRFTLVLKDIVNGAPTAYHDLEALLKDSEKQLDKLFGEMPPFVQTLVKSLPAKMTSTLGPEILAAASEKPDDHLKAQSASYTAAEAESSTDGAKKKKSKKGRIPQLKSLVSEQGAVAGMLRSILNFLKLRFPAFVTGTNVLMSLAVFILLFVFWYCHKRGKETRLAREAESKNASDVDSSEMEESVDDLEKSVSEEKPDPALENLPSVLNLPDPAEVPLPKADEGAEKKDLAKEPPLEAKTKK